MTKNLLIATFCWLVCNVAIAQDVNTLRIPSDADIVTLSENVLIETAQLKLDIAAGSVIISKARQQKYKGFEETLVKVRDRLVVQQDKIAELQGNISKLEASLEEIANITDVELLEDIRNLAQIKEDLAAARADLSQSNSELEQVKGDLEKTTAKLEKQKKFGNVLKGIIGAAGLVVGIVIGNAL